MLHQKSESRLHLQRRGRRGLESNRALQAGDPRGWFPQMCESELSAKEDVAVPACVSPEARREEVQLDVSASRPTIHAASEAVHDMAEQAKG